MQVVLKLKALQAIKNVKLDREIVQSAGNWVKANNQKNVVSKVYSLWRFAFL